VQTTASLFHKFLNTFFGNNYCLVRESAWFLRHATTLPSQPVTMGTVNSLDFVACNFALGDSQGGLQTAATAAAAVASAGLLLPPRASSRQHTLLEHVSCLWATPRRQCSLQQCNGIQMQHSLNERPGRGHMYRYGQAFTKAVTSQLCWRRTCSVKPWGKIVLFITLATKLLRSAIGATWDVRQRRERWPRHFALIMLITTLNGGYHAAGIP